MSSCNYVCVFESVRCHFTKEDKFPILWSMSFLLDYFSFASNPWHSSTEIQILTSEIDFVLVFLFTVAIFRRLVTFFLKIHTHLFGLPHMVRIMLHERNSLFRQSTYKVLNVVLNAIHSLTTWFAPTFISWVIANKNHKKLFFLSVSNVRHVWNGYSP